ncbi:lantibiotic dehydratase [Mucilaginibacter sp.]
MSYLFAKHLLLRMPVKIPADYAAESQTFLNDPFFRSALYLASPSFFSSLEQRHFQSEKLSEKEKITLRKYINRYCFRPTPFGLFSSVSLIQWATAPGPQVQAPPNFTVSIHADQTYQAILGQDLLDKELNGLASYEANPSIYRALNEYRFFRTGLDESFRQREYLLQSIAFSKLLKDLIAYCRPGRTLQEITLYLMASAACSGTEGKEYANFLIDAQLLVNRLRPNITGPDYLGRLAGIVNNYQKNTSRTQAIGRLTEASIKDLPIEPGSFQSLSRELKNLLPAKRADLNPDQLSVILHRSPENQAIDIRYQEQLRDGIYALDVLSPKDQLPAMAQFISSYQQHFEEQRLSLLHALDPETGIGYQQAVPEMHNPLLETLHISYKTSAEPATSWTAVHSLLMETWLRHAKAERPVIRLEEKEIQKLQSPDEQKQVLGLSVLFRVIDEKVFIESAGGINAPALMGRFTMVSDASREAAKNMARQQELQNPDIIFAELLHLADPHVDNVNRRESIYHYELPITAVSTLPAEQQLELSNLYISIENNLAVLYSEKHGKRVIPRLTSAYNHSLNKLPLFRFLADLSYQYGRYNLAFDLRLYFPNLSFYPRVAYKDTLLSLATWIISPEQVNGLQHQDNIQTITAFKKLSSSIHLPEHFSLVEGDQQLVFNQKKDEDILFFCNCIRQKKEAVLKEFPAQADIRQFNAYVLPGEPLGLPLPQNIKSGKTDPAVKTQRKYVPGSEWLYLKFYVPKTGTDRLLLQLQPLFNKQYGAGKISKWFFIRYEDHSPHIRLRLQVAPKAISEVLTAFKEKLADRIRQHVVREYQIDVYSRELERYAAAGMEKTESFFWASSELVLSFLKQNNLQMAGTAHHFALYSTLPIIQEFIPDLNEQLQFTLAGYQAFLPEFTDQPVKVALDKKYRELASGIQTALKAEHPSLMSGSIKAGRNFNKTLRAVQESIPEKDERRIPYLRSIIHMHLNRIFTDESRKQEMVTYYLLYKYLLSIKGRNIKG